MFLRRYALYGAALLLPVLFWKILHPFSRFSFLVFAGYTLYIISVGGDVLYAGRFFVPVLFFFYFPLADALYRLSEFLPLSKKLSFGIMALALAACTCFFPLGNLQTSAAGERGLIARMSGFGRFFAQDEKAKSFSLSSIGAFSYYVGEKPVYDMLGLTEPEIAKNPEQIEGLKSTWKEKRFNAGYILSKKPDVIFFPTRFKPASPAEKALLLYPGFRQNYRLEIYFGNGILLPYCFRFQDRPVPNVRDQSPAFVELFNQSVDALETRQFPAALDGLRHILAQGPNDFPVLYMLTGYAHHALGQPDSAEVYLKKALEADGGGSLSRFYYRNFLFNEGRFAEVRVQDSVLLRTVPGAVSFLIPVPASPRF
jgi:tetratricopeptide (TPR) repeat protein